MALDTTGCIGNSIITASGRYFDYAEPAAEMVEMEDIATALANICRFGGHCQFYSVAEHSVHAANLALERQPGDYAFAWHALLHDAAEAYVGDMPKPLKLMMPEFRHVEKRVESVIRERFDLVDWWDIGVKKIDLCLLKAEKIALFPDDKCTWTDFDSIAHVDVEFGWWTPWEARIRFLKAVADIQANGLGGGSP